MTIPKFIIPPDNSAYAVADGAEVIAIKLEGGASRYRKDILNSTSLVDVSWQFNDLQYKYFRSFFKALLQSGSLPFLIDLILDNPEVEEMSAYFVPNSIKLNGCKGLSYFVSAQLEVEPPEIDIESEADFAAMYSLFGPDWAVTIVSIDGDLQELLNVTFPGYLL